MSVRVNDVLYVMMHDVSRSLRRATAGDVSVDHRVTLKAMDRYPPSDCNGKMVNETEEVTTGSRASIPPKKGELVRDRCLNPV